jgi:hypothetical protein
MARSLQAVIRDYSHSSLVGFCKEAEDVYDRGRQGRIACRTVEDLQRTCSVAVAFPVQRMTLRDRTSFAYGRSREQMHIPSTTIIIVLDLLRSARSVPDLQWVERTVPFTAAADGDASPAAHND